MCREGRTAGALVIGSFCLSILVRNLQQISKDYHWVDSYAVDLTAALVPARLGLLQVEQHLVRAFVQTLRGDKKLLIGPGDMLQIALL